MISVNNIKVNPTIFPDGTQGIMDFNVSPYMGIYTIRWKYVNDSELVTLIYIVNHLRSTHPDCSFELVMPYCPNARMDRVKSDKEVFTMKWFAGVINSLKFDRVFILDAHSNVSLALIDNVVPLRAGVDKIISHILKTNDISKRDTLIYFPDEGSLKRYGSEKCFNEFTKIHGSKLRVWETGEIIGLSVIGPNGTVQKVGDNIVEGKNVLMVDDIISYGGTMLYSYNVLNSLGAADVSIYATHTENSVLDKSKSKVLPLLDSGKVSKLYTTDSIFSGSHPKIETIKVYTNYEEFQF